jgi:hypothetical protein
VPGWPALLEAGERTTGVPAEIIDKYFHAPSPVKELAAKYKGDVPAAANGMRDEMNSAVNKTQQILEAPVKKPLADRISSLASPDGSLPTPEQMGDRVKQQISQTLQAKNAPFVNAYGTFDKIGNVTPISDDARKKFGDQLVDWATTEFPQNSGKWRDVKNYKDMFQASNTGAQFDSVVKDIGDDMRAAYRSGQTDKAKFLGDLKNKANEFLETQTNGIAARVAAGTASPDEMKVIEQIAQSRGIQGENLQKYAKSLAKDYFTGRDQIKNDYSAFKDFQADIQEQTKTSGRGVTSMIQNITDVPSQKLMDKMADPKNAAALRKMIAQMPEAAQLVKNYMVQNIVDKSTIDNTLDLNKYYDNVMKLPVDMRNVIFSPQEIGQLQKTVNNPVYKKFNDLVDATSSMRTPLADPNGLIKAGQPGTNESHNLIQLSNLTGSNMTKQAQSLAGMKYFATGKERATTQALKAALAVARPPVGIAQAIPSQIPGNAVAPLYNSVMTNTVAPTIQSLGQVFQGQK